MNDKDSVAAQDALAQWFQSQGISVEDAVIVMCRSIARCVYALSPDQAALKQGLEIVGDIVRTMKVTKTK